MTISTIDKFDVLNDQLFMDVVRRIQRVMSAEEVIKEKLSEYGYPRCYIWEHPKEFVIWTLQDNDPNHAKTLTQKVYHRTGEDMTLLFIVHSELVWTDTNNMVINTYVEDKKKKEEH